MLAPACVKMSLSTHLRICAVLGRALDRRATSTHSAFFAQVKRTVECRDVVVGCKSLEGIGQHYALPRIEVTGVVLIPSLPVAA